MLRHHGGSGGSGESSACGRYAVTQAGIEERGRDEPTIALIAVPDDGAAGERLRRWVTGWQALMNRTTTAIVPSEWLHLPLATLGLAADAPAGLEQLVTDAITASPWASAVDGEVASCDYDLRGVYAPTGSDGGIYTDAGMMLGNLSLAAVHAATAAGVADAHLAAAKPDQPRWIVGNHRSARRDPWQAHWHRLRAMSPHVTYPIDRLLLVDLSYDAEHHHHTWRPRQDIPLPRRAPYADTGASTQQVMDWYLATSVADAFDLPS